MLEFLFLSLSLRFMLNTDIFRLNWIERNEKMVDRKLKYFALYIFIVGTRDEEILEMKKRCKLLLLNV